MGKLILNGKEYVNSRIDGYPPIIYSSEEREVGVWTDGKPLYEKTFHNTFSNVPVDTSQTVADLTSLSIDKMIKMEGFTHLTRSSGNLSIFLDNGEYMMFDYVPNNGCLLRFQQKYAGSSDCDVYCAIQYTKTTDMPGSGQWTTQGEVTHHYSASEKVIGTWIDGKPIYEKTLAIDNPPTGNTAYAHNIPNMDQVIDYSSFGTNSNNVSIKASPLQNLGEYWFAVYNIDRTNISSNIGSAWGIIKLIITLQYTKTTD